MNASLDERLRHVKWGQYKLGDLFEILSYRKRFDANKVTVSDNGGHPYIVRQSVDNGQKGNIDEDPVFLNPGNTISFGQDTATIFYQEKPYFTGDKIKILKPKCTEFNKSNADFFLCSMRKTFSTFEWGRSRFNVDTLKSQIINLPVSNDKIDFSFMESYIRELEEVHIKKLSAYFTENGLKNCELSSKDLAALTKFETFQENDWHDYKIGNLFEKIETNKLPYKADDLPKQATGKYVLPCLTSSFQNQGLNYFVPREGATVLRHVISIPSNSDVYRAYYQSRDFTVLSDAYAIRWRSTEIMLSPNQYLFMVMCINKVTNLSIYSYKNKLGGWNVVKNKYIKLPQKDGTIDFAFMEAFISAIKKIILKDVIRYTDKRARH